MDSDSEWPGSWKPNAAESENSSLIPSLSSWPHDLESLHANILHGDGTQMDIDFLSQTWTTVGQSDFVDSLYSQLQEEQLEGTVVDPPSQSARRSIELATQQLQNTPVSPSASKNFESSCENHSQLKAITDDEDQNPRRLRRKAQNRAAQQAFRARKERYEKELRGKLFKLEVEVASLNRENNQLKETLAKGTEPTSFSSERQSEPVGPPSIRRIVSKKPSRSTQNTEAYMTPISALQHTRSDSGFESEISATSPLEESHDKHINTQRHGHGPTTTTTVITGQKYILLRRTALSEEDEDILLAVESATQHSHTRQVFEIIKLGKRLDGLECLDQ